MSLFTWTNTGNFPAGSYAWNGQPLAVPPAQTYFTPSPPSAPTKIPAENWNSILGQIAGNLANLQPSSIATWGSNTTIVVPSNVHYMWIAGFGGGGGGGGGGGTVGATNTVVAGGSGGAGAPFRSMILAVTPGASYDVYIGIGGTGGTVSGQSPTDGTDGTPTYVTPHGQPATVIASFPGGAAGHGLPFGSGTNAITIWCPGGVGIAGATRGPIVAQNTTLRDPVGGQQEGQGGALVAGTGNGGAYSQSYPGVGSGPFPGGTSGSGGNAAGSYVGGAGGGGGGAGPGGAGGAGGAGGNGNSSGTGAAATAGANANFNSGGGGGGGGGGGAGSGGGGVQTTPPAVGPRSRSIPDRDT